MKISEQIKALLDARAAKVKALEDIQEKAAKEARSKDAKEQEEFDTISDEIESCDRELKDLRRLESVQLKQVNPVRKPPESEGSGAFEEEIEDEHVYNRPGAKSIIAIPRNLQKGIMMARFVKSLYATGKPDAHAAGLYAKAHYNDTPQLVQVFRAMRDGLDIKATVNGGTTTDATWAGPLVAYNQFAGDFIDFLRPQTIIGKFGTGNIPALRNVPFNIHIRGQTSGGQGYWVGQGQPKPLTKYDFEDVYLEWAKIATIAVLSKELIRFSNPSAEALVRDALAASIIERADIDFVDPTKAAVSHVSPASVTNGVTPIASSGSTSAHIRQDIAAAMQVMIDNNISPTTAVWIMSATIAMHLSLVRNAFGQKDFPDITVNGGSLEGIPVITSQYMPSDTSGGLVVLANASDIWMSDDGQVTIDASTEASLQMLDNPTNASSNGTATTMVSMFQTNSVALLAERYINWKKRRANAVVTISGVVWTGG